MFMRPLSLAAAGLLLTIAAAGTSWADRSDGIDPSTLAPGLLQAKDAVARLERLTDEAEAIGNALFRVHNGFGDHRRSSSDAPTCETGWLLDLGARTREFGRAFRDAVQSARVQASRVEDLTVEPTVQPLLDPETNHKVLSLLARVDDLVRRYPETSSWQERYVEPLLRNCQPALVPAAGMAEPVPGAIPVSQGSSTAAAMGAATKKEPLIAVLAFGGGWLCPGAVPAAGVMLVTGKVCYSLSESCDCEPEAVSPAAVLGPEPVVAAPVAAEAAAPTAPASAPGGKDAVAPPAKPSTGKPAAVAPPAKPAAGKAVPAKPAAGKPAPAKPAPAKPSGAAFRNPNAKSGRSPATVRGPATKAGSAN